MSDVFLKVQYDDDTLGEVKPYQLDKLISLGRVKKFLRSGGWVTIGKNKTRTVEMYYQGSERRKPFTIRFL